MKCDVTVSKKFTINTGDFSSIQPNNSLTIKDVEVVDAIRVHSLLSNIVDGLFHKQILDDGKTMATIKNMGLGKYLQGLDMEMLDDDIQKSLEQLKEKF